MSKQNAITIVIVSALLAVGIFFPPVLLLNIPIIIFRSALLEIGSSKKK